MYWDAVLKEVLNKEDPACNCPFTTVKEHTRTVVNMVREPRVRAFGYTRYKQYPLGEAHPGIYFTEREAQTMLQLLYGKSTAEIATFLNLSRRTIEFYVKNMKTKLSCRLKSELICKVLASEFMKKIDFA